MQLLNVLWQGAVLSQPAVRCDAMRGRRKGTPNEFSSSLFVSHLVLLLPAALAPARLLCTERAGTSACISTVLAVKHNASIWRNGGS